jgi:hypothetical protein
VQPASRRWPDWARATAAALALHVWVLVGGVEIGRQAEGVQTPAPRTRAAAVRHVQLARPAPALTPDLPAEAAASRPRREPVRVPPRTAAVAALPAPAPAVPDPVPVLEGTPPAADPDEGAPPPVYRTRLPPAFAWHYAVQRGARSGHSELQFTRNGGDYQLGWESRWLGRESLGLVSRGAVDEAGLAPDRFADRRRGRERQAANFDRAGGRITYSGPQVEHALLAGAQDRLSWMVQLPAIVDADPAALAAPGSRVRLQVSGARGDAGVWTFIVQGREDLDLPAGAVRDTLYLLREARRPYDTRVEVWLDAGRHHLPVRVRLTPVPGGEPLDMRLDSAPPS